MPARQHLHQQPSRRPCSGIVDRHQLHRARLRPASDPGMRRLRRPGTNIPDPRPLWRRYMARASAGHARHALQLRRQHPALPSRPGMCARIGRCRTRSQHQPVSTGNIRRAWRCPSRRILACNRSLLARAGRVVAARLGQHIHQAPPSPNAYPIPAPAPALPQ